MCLLTVRDVFTHTVSKYDIRTRARAVCAYVPLATVLGWCPGLKNVALSITSFLVGPGAPN